MLSFHSVLSYSLLSSLLDILNRESLIKGSTTIERMNSFSLYCFLCILSSTSILATPYAQGRSGSGAEPPSRDTRKPEQTEPKPLAAAPPLQEGKQTGVVKLKPVYGQYGSLNLYTIPVKVGSAELQMVLDTGSNRMYVVPRRTGCSRTVDKKHKIATNRRLRFYNTASWPRPKQRRPYLM